MNHYIKSLATLLGLMLCLVCAAKGQESTKKNTLVEINKGMMTITFQIQGIGSSGTGFILKKLRDQNELVGYKVFVTAKHVLDEIEGEYALITLRREIASEIWESKSFRYKIRIGDNPVWISHPTEDVAAFYIDVPKAFSVPGLNTNVLATDEILEKYGLRPGEEINCLGYPLGMKGPFGFPILRSGKVASYPLLPTKVRKTFYFDFEVFPGNSGGPVYVDFGGFRGNILRGGQAGYILGLVSQERVFANRLPLSIATVVHASLILETINLLPDRTSESGSRRVAMPVR